MIDARALLVGVLDALEHDPELAQRARAVLGASPAPDDLLDLGEAATFARCGTRSLRDAVRTGQIPALRSGRGGRILIQQSAITAWLTARAVIPKAAPAMRSDGGKFAAADRAIARATAEGRLRRVV